MTSLNFVLTDKPAIAPPVFVFQKDKAQKVSSFFGVRLWLEVEAPFLEQKVQTKLVRSLAAICGGFKCRGWRRWISCPDQPWLCLSHRFILSNIFLPLSDSDKDEGTYCPPVKRERTSSFPPPHSGKVMWFWKGICFMLACGVHIDLYAECSAPFASLQFPRTMYSCPQVSASLQLGTLTLSQVRHLDHYFLLTAYRPLCFSWILNR